jgi:serine/threonine-protein kinase
MTFIGAASLGIGRRNLAISHDGTLMAYVGVQGGVTRLFVRPLDEYESTALPGTEGAYGPFFSPNGRYIGFFVENELRKVAIEGGDPVVLATVANPMGADWGLDDHIVFDGREGSELLRVSADGGPVERVFQATPESEVNGTLFPSLLPDGQSLLVQTFSNQIAVIDLSTGRGRILRSSATDARYVAPGLVVYGSGSTLFASRFDGTRHALIGQSVPVLAGVRSEVYGRGQWAVSGGGDLVYAPGGAVAEGPLTSTRNRSLWFGLRSMDI